MKNAVVSLFLSVFFLVLTSCGGGSSNTVQSPKNDIVTLNENEIQQWEKILINDDRMQDLSILTNFDTNSDPYIFCGINSGVVRCFQNVLYVENARLNAFGSRYGDITSRKLVELPVPAEAKNAKSVFVESRSVSGDAAKKVFCVNDSESNSCWYYLYDFNKENGLASCADRDRKFTSPLYDRVWRIGASGLMCTGAFAELNGYSYHFYSEKSFNGKLGVRVERCTLDRQIDKQFGENGSLTIEDDWKEPIGFVDIVASGSKFFYLGFRGSNGVSIHRVNSDLTVSKSYLPVSNPWGQLTGLKVNNDQSLSATIRARIGPWSYTEMTGVVHPKGGRWESTDSTRQIDCQKRLY